MKHSAPAAIRNREPIAEVLREELPGRGLVLEIASGTGEHALHFARRFPALDWQPSDAEPQALASIEAWRIGGAAANLRPPVMLDASGPDWPLTSAAAILCINMVHISPRSATAGLFAGAARLLLAGAPLILYGPYLERDVRTAASNLAFDRSLKLRDPRWGLRRVDWLDRLAQENGFERTRRVGMPANNVILVYRRCK